MSEEDIKKGITTIEEKLERDCMYFSRMDALFGDRQNVNPSHACPTLLNKDVCNAASIESQLFAPLPTQSEVDSSLSGSPPTIGTSNEQSSTEILKIAPLDSQSSKRKNKPDNAFSFFDDRMSERLAYEDNRARFESQEVTKRELAKTEVDLQKARLELEGTRRALLLELLDKGKTAKEVKELDNCFHE